MLLHFPLAKRLLPLCLSLIRFPLLLLLLPSTLAQSLISLKLQRHLVLLLLQQHPFLPLLEIDTPIPIHIEHTQQLRNVLLTKLQLATTPDPPQSTRELFHANPPRRCAVAVILAAGLVQIKCLE
jgi:hypothetical protein